jgi:septal ring factor EnvC (AmiA/AmiB activator)
MTHYQDKLEKLQKSIAKVQQHLKGSKKQRSDVVTELQTLEVEISKTSRKLKSLENDVYKSRRQEKMLKSELNQLNKQLAEQRAILSEQIRSAYSMGNQQNLKMLLNQQDPAQAGRTQAYFSYLNRARQQQIDTFLATFELKKQTESQLKQTLSAQNELLKAQKEKK